MTNTNIKTNDTGQDKRQHGVDKIQKQMTNTNIKTNDTGQDKRQR